MEKLSVVFLVVLCASACAVAPSMPTATESSVLCRIVADPTAFEGQEVTVRGVFASDYQHYSSLIDPSCPRGLPPYGSGDELGRAALDAALCSESGGLVEVTARGRVESRVGEFPSVRFHVEEYSDAQAVAFNSTWVDPYGVLRSESDMRWDNRRMRMCFSAGYIDPETRERRELQ